MPTGNIPEENQICCGGRLPKTSLKLKAGCLSMLYEDGSIRYISDGKNEIIRMIYSAVRDKEWLTIIPDISDEKIDIRPDSFNIEYQCIYRSGEINFSAWYRIEGHPDSTLTFSFEGEALNTFQKSRIGFCVLHPVEGISGQPCIITHNDGSSETLSFPVYISPHQPFTDITSMKWRADGSECTLIFSGALFETEDQRNWTDASYKTYCTPLRLPHPVIIKKGERISQGIEFKTTGENINELTDKDEINISINLLESSVLPHLGIGRSTRPAPITKEEIRILRKLHFDHYRADLYLFRNSWKTEADLAAGEALRLNWALELALFFDENYPGQIKDFIEWVTPWKAGISVVMLFHKSEAVTTDVLLFTIAPELKKTLPDVRIGCGTNANFAQLNRKVPDLANADHLCYSIHPQEHASDNATLVENLKGQSYTVASARQFAQGKGIRISPVNLRRRFNANIENSETIMTEGAFPSQADSRLMSLFGACWTAGSLKYLSESGAEGLTYYETVGERGIIQGVFDSRWPAEFRTVKGMVFPVCHLFNWILKDKSFRVMHSSSSSPVAVDCLALGSGTRVKLAIMNFTSVQQRVLIHGLSFRGKIKILNAQTYSTAVNDFSWIEKDWKKISIETGQMRSEPYSLSFLEGFPD